MSTVKDFNLDLFKNGLQRSHSFEIEITLPQTISSVDSLDKLRIRSEFTSIQPPVLETNKYRHGNTYLNVPVERSFEQLTLGFLPDSNVSQFHILSKWMDTIIHGHHMTDVKYFDSYLGEIKLNMYNANNKKTSSFKFLEVYPSNVSQLEMNKSIKDDISRFTCSFFYTDMIPDTSSTINNEHSNDNKNKYILNSIDGNQLMQNANETQNNEMLSSLNNNPNSDQVLIDNMLSNNMLSGDSNNTNFDYNGNNSTLINEIIANSNINV